MNEGWIKIHRRIQKNPIVMKDGDHLAIWVYLLLRAAHRPHESIFDSKRIILDPGQLITGRKSISLTLGISESKIQRVLKCFESEQQIKQQSCSRSRLISILNWSEYQNSEQQIEQQVNNNRTASEQQVNTIQELKNKRIVVDDDPLFQMFRRSAASHITDEELIIERGKFLNKYPHLHINQCGPVVNKWVSNIGRVDETVKKMVL